MSSPHAVVDHAAHTPFSDPGRFAERVADLPTDPESLSAVARNLIVHYRASGHELPESTRGDVNTRWLAKILALDAQRHSAPLSAEREATERVQGCCRDHTLFCVGVLREHGVAARSRVGFAGYFLDGFHPDHVVVEAWIDDCWRRFDPEIDTPPAVLPDPMDMASGAVDGTGFVTAAQVWLAHRAGDVDASTYGVDPSLPLFTGERFVFDEVIYEIAHRFGDELLLWDSWGRIGTPGEPVRDADAAWIDEIARLLVAADAGDLDAETRLHERYRTDPGLHPGATITQASPFGDPPVTVALGESRTP